MLTVPVAFFIFNRPRLTARIADAIQAASPSALYVVADGPRPDVPEDVGLTAATRAVIDDRDWGCPVHRSYASANMGCGRRVASGLDWVFEDVEAAIILEDDCLPDPSFFRFCETLLDRYRDDSRVAMVSGTNEAVTWLDGGQDYIFAGHGSVWGWATWRRAWQGYDFSAASLDDPTARAAASEFVGDEEIYQERLYNAERARSGAVDTWDYQWTWSRMVHKGLVAVSTRNLISNLGFGPDATHTTGYDMRRANLHRHAAPDDLRGPDRVAADPRYDRHIFELDRQAITTQTAIDQAERLLAAGRAIHALALLQSQRNRGGGSEQLDTLIARATDQLRRRPAVLPDGDAVPDSDRS